MTADAVENSVPPSVPGAETAAQTVDQPPRAAHVGEDRPGAFVLASAPDQHGATGEAFWDAVRSAPSTTAALRLLFGHAPIGSGRERVDRLTRLLNYHIAQLDTLLTEQVNAILH